MCDFCLNWLHKYALILPKHFFSNRFYEIKKCLQMLSELPNYFAKNLQISPLAAEKRNFFAADFLKMAHLLCKYAIISSKIYKNLCLNTIHFIFLGMIL